MKIEIECLSNAEQKQSELQTFASAVAESSEKVLVVGETARRQLDGVSHIYQLIIILQQYKIYSLFSTLT